MQDPCCAVCGKRVPWNWFLCRDCHSEYGDFDEWPDWLRELKRNEQRRRYRIKRGDYSHPPYFDDEPIDDRYPSEISLDFAFEVCEEMGVDWESEDWDAYQD